MIQPRRGRRLGAVVIALLSVITLGPREATAASCSGQSHDLLLSAGTVSPASGSTATNFGFSVIYTDNAGCPPDPIVVVIDGIGTFPLPWISGDLTTGATFGQQLPLPAGTWGYHFDASSGTGVGQRTVTFTNVDPAVVQVLAPPPPPKPTPTPKPTPPPTPPPTQAPPAPTDTPPPAATPSTPVESPTGPVASLSTPVPTATPSVASTGAIGGVIGGPPPPPAGAGGASWSTIFDLNHVPRPLLALAVSSAGTLAGLGLFVLLSGRLLGASRGGGLRLAPVAGRRTRRNDQPVESVPEPTPTSDVMAPPAAVDPAWSGSKSRAPILFSAPPGPGIDRCRIVSRLVPLRSEPDELSRLYSARLDVGDEVDVLRQDGPFCFVQTPSGAEGWVPGLTLTGASVTAQEAPDDGR